MSFKSEFHDVFISYRREKGAAIARLLKMALEPRGITVFMDFDSLGSGHFGEALLKQIEEAKNFIVILTPGDLDRCHDSSDWMRLEISHAIKTRRNIIPVFVDNFQFPVLNEIPKDIRSIAKHQGVTYSHEFFEAFLKRIISYLRTESDRKVQRHFRVAFIVAVSIVAIAISGLLVVLYHGSRPTEQPGQSKKATSAVQSTTHGKLDDRPRVQPYDKGEKSEGSLFVLSIGISKYKDPRIPALRYAAKDAHDFGNFFTHQDNLYRESSIRILTDEMATRVTIFKEIWGSLKTARHQDTIIIFLSGHAAIDPVRLDDTYFLAYDTDVNNFFGTAVDLSRLDFLKRLDSHKIVMFTDLVRAGGFNRSHPSDEDFFRMQLEKAGEGHIAIVTSSRQAEASREMADYGYNLFTHLLLRGLRGEADVDEKGAVTLGSLFSFLRTKMREVTGGGKDPQLIGSGLENIPLSMPFNSK